jgi:hypothetical protein
MQKQEKKVHYQSLVLIIFMNKIKNGSGQPHSESRNREPTLPANLHPMQVRGSTKPTNIAIIFRIKGELTPKTALVWLVRNGPKGYGFGKERGAGSTRSGSDQEF